MYSESCCSSSRPSQHLPVCLCSECVGAPYSECVLACVSAYSQVYAMYWGFEQSSLCSFAFRENLLARQTLEQNIVHTGATDLDVAMFHRDGGKHAHTFTYNRKVWKPYIIHFPHCCSSLSSQVRTQTQTLTFLWRRSAVSPFLPLRARTTSDCAGASSADSSAPITASVCSPSPPTTAPKVNTWNIWLDY